MSCHLDSAVVRIFRLYLSVLGIFMSIPDIRVTYNSLLYIVDNKIIVKVYSSNIDSSISKILTWFFLTAINIGLLAYWMYLKNRAEESAAVNSFQLYGDNGGTMS